MARVHSLQRIRRVYLFANVARGFGFTDQNNSVQGTLVGEFSWQFIAMSWIESSKDSPYFIIGRTHYAKPILDLLLRHDLT